MLKTDCLVMVVLALCIALTGCSSNGWLTQFPVSNRVVHLSKSEFRSVVEQRIAKYDSIDDLKRDLELDGYNVRYRENGDLWAIKELPGVYSTSFVYDMMVRMTDTGMEIVRAEVFGNGP